MSVCHIDKKMYIQHIDNFSRCGIEKLSLSGIDKHIFVYISYIKKLFYIMYGQIFHMQYRQRYFFLYLIYTIFIYHVYIIVSLSIFHMDIFSIHDVDKIPYCIVHTYIILLISIRNITYILLYSI